MQKEFDIFDKIVSFLLCKPSFNWPSPFKDLQCPIHNGTLKSMTN